MEPLLLQHDVCSKVAAAICEIAKKADHIKVCKEGDGLGFWHLPLRTWASFFLTADFSEGSIVASFANKRMFMSMLMLLTSVAKKKYNMLLTKGSSQDLLLIMLSESNLIAWNVLPEQMCKQTRQNDMLRTFASGAFKQRMYVCGPGGNQDVIPDALLASLIRFLTGRGQHYMLFLSGSAWGAHRDTPKSLLDCWVHLR